VIATESGHDIQHEQPEPVLDAIRDVVHAVQSGDLIPH
jgi:pimeloyl-ACP methyl ester carboxylesterase